MKSIAMKIISVTFSFLVISNYVLAQAPEHYYDSAKNKTGYALKTALFNTIKNPTVQPRKTLWGYIIQTDNQSGKVWDMYSDIPQKKNPYTYEFVKDRCDANYNHEPCYSCENLGFAEGKCYALAYAFPISWFFGERGGVNEDLFNIYPVDKCVKSMRQNYPYGEVNGLERCVSMNGSKLGATNVGLSYMPIVFEPIDAYKGDFARTYFYMATCYQDRVPGWKNKSPYGAQVLDGSDSTVFQPWYLKMLLEWHKEDPVSQKEMDRNNMVFIIQDNRNPFIDSPDFVNIIWGN